MDSGLGTPKIMLIEGMKLNGIERWKHFINRRC